MKSLTDTIPQVWSKSNAMTISRFVHSKIFLLLVVWRVSSVFIVQTSHVPDEYWQSLEVAHKLSFDYGYLTWEWQVGIRSYLYPFFISILYSLLKFLQIDYVFVLTTLPRIFQALLCAYSEYKFYLWTGSSKFALFNLCINWYWYYCATRTLINSIETCLTIIALSKYPWKENPKRSSNFLWIVAFLCFARPTAAILWLPLCFYHLFKNKTLIIRYLIVGLSCLIVSLIIDIICYGRFILTPWEFFKINVLNSISEQYGKMHPLWYLFSGLPVLLGLNYILVPYAIYKSFKNYASFYKSAILAFTVIWYISINSLLAHKEFRFILPILPMLIYIINESVFLEIQFKNIIKKHKKLLIFLLIATNILPGFYFSVLHQKGPLNVMKHLRSEVEISNTSEINILFLTSCHATPYYSHLHKNVSMRFLTCEPNLQRIVDYQDEANVFSTNPMKWLQINYLNQTANSLPSHNIDKGLDEICEALDDLTIKNLELIEEKILVTLHLEKLFRQGHIDLAKARYIRGKESVGMLQIPSEETEMKSLFDLETTYVKSEQDDTMEVPHFDISIKKCNNKDDEQIQDPLKWFGVLVPQSLKSAQKHFQDTIYLTAKLANIQSELAKVNTETKSLILLKEDVKEKDAKDDDDA